MTKASKAAEVDYSSGPSFKPSEAARAAMADRKARGPVELVRVAGTGGPVTVRPIRLSWPVINQRDYTRLELADMAAEAKRIEREAKRAEAARQFRVSAVQRSAELVLKDMTPAEIIAKARPEFLAARSMREAAEAMGVPASELAEALAVERELSEADRVVSAEATPVEILDWPEDKADREAAEAARKAAAEAAREAARPKYTREALAASEAAKAGREALAAIGPVASAVVITRAEARHISVAVVQKTPGMSAAYARAEAAAERLAEARERLAEAETRVVAAKAAKAVRPLREADREADRIAASVAKLAKRAEAADQALAAASAVAELPAADGLVYFPLAAFTLAEADRASELDIPARADRMPALYIESGPAVNWARSVSGRGYIGPAAGGASDPTGDSAAALADGYRMELARAEAAAAKLAAKTTRDACEAAASEAREAKRIETNTKRAAAARVRRRAAKLANR